jgi:non-heme chloroperoxidase
MCWRLAGVCAAARNIAMRETSLPAHARRRFLATAAVAAASATTLAATGLANATAEVGFAGAHSAPRTLGNASLLGLRDGTQLFFRDWGSGPAVVFSHGWPLTADAWDPQLLFLAAQGFRVIAHDRRGHGRSSQPAKGNDMDTYADDLAELVDALQLRSFAMVGHSTGGGEVAHFIGRHNGGRVTRAVLISAVAPHLAMAADNPQGAPLSVFDGLRASVAGNRSEFYQQLALPFYGFNTAGAAPVKGTVDSFWAQAMSGSVQASYECIKAFSETDFTNDLRSMSMPTLLIQGDADQIVPFALAAPRQAQLIRHNTLKVYPGAPHGLCTTHADAINADLLEFLKG